MPAYALERISERTQTRAVAAQRGCVGVFLAHGISPPFSDIAHHDDSEHQRFAYNLSLRLYTPPRILVNTFLPYRVKAGAGF